MSKENMKLLKMKAESVYIYAHQWSKWKMAHQRFNNQRFCVPKCVSNFLDDLTTICFWMKKGPEWIAKETEFNAASDVAYIVGKMQCLN